MIKYENADSLANDFFRRFSRTEYALKITGYHNGDGKKEVKADWRKFALTIEEVIANPTSLELKEAIDFIFNAPPNKQIVVNGNLQWSSAEPNTDSCADKLLIYVRRVRNNLFHGGKFNGHWFEPERSESLLKNSLIILVACIDAIPKVRDAYYG